MGLKMPSWCQQMCWKSTDAGGRPRTNRNRNARRTHCFVMGFVQEVCADATQFGAQKRTRTSTSIQTLRPERSASTNSAIWARGRSAGYGHRPCASTRYCFMVSLILRVIIHKRKPTSLITDHQNNFRLRGRKTGQCRRARTLKRMHHQTTLSMNERAPSKLRASKFLAVAQNN